jgi:hypothetical protein
MKPDALGCHTVYVVSPDGFLGVHHSRPHERKAFVGQSVLRRFIKQSMRPERVQMIYTSQGNWQTALIE